MELRLRWNRCADTHVDEVRFVLFEQSTYDAFIVLALPSDSGTVG
jgi:hypothetical protein